jgi:hypothetical protein
MKKQFIPLFCTALVLLAVSCKKSQDGGSNAISGNYNLVNIHAHTHSIVDESDGIGDDLTTESVSDYISIDNGGGIDITGNTMSTVKFTYSVSTELLGAEYYNGVFQDSLSQPFDITIPPTSNSSTYKLIGTDSIYFPSGFISSPSGGAPVQSVAVGGKYALSGNTLTMTITLPPQVSTENESGGITATLSSDAVETVTLQKQ